MGVVKLAGKTKIVATRVFGSPAGEPPFQRIAEVYFPSMEALEQCAASDGGKQTIGNAVSISSSGAPVFLVAEEETFVFESYRPVRLLLLLLLMLGSVARAVGQTKPNHLVGEHSPYLTRAMNQPVNWYPWGKDAFRRAEDLNVPILLDVGAVWCPWCILMDRDTYTNVDTANYINQHFVAVKVDFDASPKVVAQLQQAQAVLNLPAGLPLTSFITPDGRLYFGAGYLPAEHKNGKPSFHEAADEALARFANRSKVEEQSFQLELEK